jgi:tRNA threonylcarbamoyladenosine biosynthesis protein TsaE
MPILDQYAVEMISRSPEQTRRIGTRLGALLSAGDLVGLSGDLGSGKTTLVQGIVQGWGSLDIVTSPTFVLVNVYQKGRDHHFYHMDAYRLQAPSEGEDLDIDHMLQDSPLVVEWVEHVRAVLPRDGLWVDMRWIADEQRGIIFSPVGDYYQKMVAQFRWNTMGV